jgi:hypothetical protein
MRNSQPSGPIADCVEDVTVIGGGTRCRHNVLKVSC